MTPKRIEAVDLFYLSMPEITTEADGSQHALLVRAAAGGLTGYGECEAAPLPSIAAFVCPMSHGVCRPVGASVLGARLDGPEDIHCIADRVAYDSMDLLQAAHTWSGIEMALWDLLGKARGAPVWSLLGYTRSHRKTPYASQLFGDTPQETLALGPAAVIARQPLLIGAAAIAAMFGALTCAWAIAEGWRAARQATDRWPEHRWGLPLVFATLALLLILFEMQRPAIWWT